MNNSDFTDFVSPSPSDAPKIRVLKFGGSSVGTPEAIVGVAGVVRETSIECRVVVVVSALECVTDQLEALAYGDANEALGHLFSLYRQHLKTARTLLPPKAVKAYRHVLGKEFATVVPSIRRIRGRAGSKFDVDTILAAGERFSAPLISSVLRHAGLNSRHVDASHLIRVRDPENGHVDRDQTTRQIRAWYTGVSASTVPVVTGFIGASSCGRTVTLGRGGSDFTAALIAASLNAEVLERWTDVDGLYTADPERCPDARKYDQLTLEEADFLNRADQLGMHRHTLEPLIESRTPLHVRSFKQPGTGTLIMPATIIAAAT